MKRYISLIVLVLISSQSYAAGNSDHSHGQEHNHEQGAGMFAVGEPAKGKFNRQITVSMLDSMRFVFTPGLDSLKHGESIKFVVRNDGNIKHEFSIGNAKEQMAHAEMMRKMPDMHHSDPNTVSLEPGESGTLAWKFMGEDTVVFACNIPGHFEAGMHHNVKIGK